MVDLLKAFWIDESGQDAAEYAILIALIALVIILAVQALGDNIKLTFETIAAAIPGVAGGS